MEEKPFWQTKRLADMSEAEWEALCDGCAKCCLVKLQDTETSELSFTNLACHMLDLGSCRCTDYANRTARVADCVKLSKDNLSQIDFMPPSCTYRLLHEGKELPQWHPLVSGTPDSVINAGMLVFGRVLSEDEAATSHDEHIVDWPWRVKK